MDFALQSMMTQEVHVAEPVGFDSWGKATYSSPVALKCRLEKTTGVYPVARGVPGREASKVVGAADQVSHRLFLLQAIAISSLVWLPGADEEDLSQAYVVAVMDEILDDFGVLSHYEVLL